MPPCQTIDEVIDALETIVSDAIAAASPIGYFPALYRRVTIEVKRAIERGAFEDNERMRDLDIAFAQRYLDAYAIHREGGSSTESWGISFQAARSSRLTVLQHLLLGMNAHIGLDLGIAASSVGGEKSLSLKRDFIAINNILGSLIDDTQTRLVRVFGPLGLVDRLLGPIDEQLSLFSIGYARDKAWMQTLELCLGGSTNESDQIRERDHQVSGFSQVLIRPKMLRIRIALALVRLFEKGSVAERIRFLSDPS